MYSSMIMIRCVPVPFQVNHKKRKQVNVKQNIILIKIQRCIDLANYRYLSKRFLHAFSQLTAHVIDSAGRAPSVILEITTLTHSRTERGCPTACGNTVDTKHQ